MADFISVQVDKKQLKQVDRLLKAYPRSAPTVLSRAVNKTATTARVGEVRKTAKNTGLAAGALFKKGANRPITQTKATKNKTSAVILVRSLRVPLSAFKAKQTRKGVTYKVDQGGRSRISDAFMQQVFGKVPDLVARSGSGHIAVLRRIGTEAAFKRDKDGRKRLRRGKLIELFGPSIPKVIRGKIFGETVTKAQSDLLKNVDTQLAIELERAIKR